MRRQGAEWEEQQGIEMTALRRRSRKKKKPQDRRKPRRYKG